MNRSNDLSSVKMDGLLNEFNKSIYEKIKCSVLMVCSGQTIRITELKTHVL